MAAPEIAVLLRPCKHDEIINVGESNDTTAYVNKAYGFALKCDNVSISYAKTPIQVPIPQQAPQIIDLGIYRPSISLTGVVDTIGGGASTGQTGLEGMQTISFLRSAGYGGHVSARTYHVPYKNLLEDFVRRTLHSNSKPIELEWGDASIAVGDDHTGGAVYLVALQQYRVQVDAAKEDRYSFSMQFIVGERKDAD